MLTMLPPDTPALAGRASFRRIRSVSTPARRHQRGLALWWLALVGVVVILGIAYGPRIVTPYYNHYVINRSVHDVLVEAQQEGLTTPEVRERLMKRFQINAVGVAVDDIDVQSAGGTITVDIDNPVKVPLYGNAALDLDLSVHQSTADLAP